MTARIEVGGSLRFDFAHLRLRLEAKYLLVQYLLPQTSNLKPPTAGALCDAGYWLLASMNPSIGGRANLPYCDKIFIAKGECKHNG